MRSQTPSRPRLVAPFLALLLVLGGAAAHPATGEPPELSPLHFLPGDAEIGPAAGDQHQPEISRGGDRYLAVWVDQRTDLVGILDYGSGPFDALETGSMWDIYGARLDANGDVIDTTPIPVAQQVFNQSAPDVAWNGESWLVVWQGQAIADAFGNLRTHIYAARVSSEGVLLDETPILVDFAPSMDGSLWPMVGSDGESWFVVWSDVDTGQGIRYLEGLRIGPDGTVLDPGGVDVRRADYNSYPTPWDVAFLEDRYLVTFGEGVSVYGQYVAPDLTPMGEPFRISPSGRSCGAADVATDGTQFFVVFSDAQSSVRQVRAARVGTNGLIATGILVSSASGFGCYHPQTAFDGTNFLVSYERGLTLITLRGAVVDPNGTVLRNEVLLAGGADHSDYSALAPRAGGGAVVVWQDDRNGGFGRRDVMGARIEADGDAGPAYYVALGAPRQSEPETVATATGHTIVFLSDNSREVRILAQRVDAGGTPLDPEPTEVSTGGAEIASPSVAWDGSVHLVVWEDTASNQVLGVRLGADLAPIDPGPLALLAGNTPDVAASSGTFLVVASEEPVNHIRYPMAVRFDGATGQTLGPPVQLGGNYAITPRVDALGSGGWAVSWERHPTHDDPTAFVHGAFVEPDGTHSTFTVSSTVGKLPDVAASEDAALFVYSKGSPGDLDLVFRRVSAAGSFLDGSDRTLVGEARHQRDATPAWDGSRFLVEWVDDRNDAPYEQPRGDLFAARIDPDGTVLDAGGFPVRNDTLPETQPFVGGRDGIALAGGTIHRPDPGFAMPRVGYRISGMVPASVEEGSVAGPFRISVSPNPSPLRTAIGFQLDRDVPAEVSVYDVRGARVLSLHRGPLSAGRVELIWDGRDAAGRAVAPGVYFVRATLGSEVRAAKLLRR